MKQIKWPIACAIASTFLLLISACSNNDKTNIVIPNPPPGGDNVAVISNVTYSNVTDWQGNPIALQMDIYKTAGLRNTEKRPLVMFMHGGGFMDGDKTSATDKMEILADSGFIAVTINYRVGWDNDGQAESCTGDTSSFNDAAYRTIQDANAALRYLVAHADDYNIDTSWIFIGGASAGATVALNTAYVNNAYAKVRYPKQYAKFGSLYDEGNNIKATYSFKGICAIAGALPDSNLISSAKAFPAITFQGEDDEVIPINSGTFDNCTSYPFEVGSLCQYRQLTRLGVPAICNLLPGQGHGNNGDSGYDSPFMMGNTACFFHTVMRGDQIKNSVYKGVVNSCSN